MNIESLTPVNFTLALAQSALLATTVKQPMWLRVATMSSFATSMLAMKSKKSEALVLASFVELTVSGMRIANAKKTAQLKKEFGLGVGFAVCSVLSESLSDYVKKQQFKKHWQEANKDVTIL